MKGNADQVRGSVLLSNHDGIPAKFMTAPAWQHSRAQPANLRDGATIDKGGAIPLYSIASEDHLLTTAQSGDQQAFAELCRRHIPMVKKRIFSIVKNQADAEDALQESLLRAYMHLDGFRRTSKFSTWLTTIGTNTALMMLRKRKTRKEAKAELLNEESGTWQTTEYVDPCLNPEGLHSRHQIILELRREVQKLRPTLRSIVVQHYGSECSVEESAKALDISLAAAKSRLIRGRKTLRWSLEKRGVIDSRL
jgi:RNA polymerase sigma-70 factor (ECF subfamily)